MNLAMRKAEVPARAATIRLAGEEALCDPRGALFVPGLDLLVVSDLHLEKGAALARRRMLAPPYDTAATLARLAAVLADYRPGTVVSLGDSFHDRDGARLLPDLYRDAVAAMAIRSDWYWIAGNHDPEPPAGLPGHAVSELSIGGLTFRHEPLPLAGAGEIAGHLHPGARVVRRGRSIRRACFASDGERLIMPAFGAYTGTLNVLDRAFAGLFGAEGLMAYMLGRDRIFAVGGESLAAG